MEKVTYSLLQKIRKGAYSEVFKVKRLSDNYEYALKKVKLGQLNPKEKENALNEIRILASIEDPYIVEYKVLLISIVNIIFLGSIY